jgi:hypothetical protein
MTDTELAEFFYAMYSEALGNDGKGWPTWESLSDDDRARWVYVAEMAREPILNDADSAFLEDINYLEDKLDEYRSALWVILDALKPILNLKVSDEFV